MKKHGNLAFFVPHIGCPCRCSFCDQRAISGEVDAPSPGRVQAECARFLPPAGSGQNMEIAFFGGSFTAVQPAYMQALLKAAFPFVQAGRAAGIRVSTRPDAVGPEVLTVLKKYGVTAVELGAQSMVEEVLAKNRRGHTAQEVRRGAAAVRGAGFSLGVQMMIGLPFEGDLRAAALYTARELIALGPDTARIYPALTLAGTQMARWLEQGLYRPPSLKEAVEVSAEVLTLFEEAGVRVIRVGLHADPSLEKQLLAGPYHPAFRQLCEGERYLQRIRLALAQRPAGVYTVKVAPGELSTARGQRNKNVQTLARQGAAVVFCEDAALKKGQFSIE